MDCGWNERGDDSGRDEGGLGDAIAWYFMRRCPKVSAQEAERLGLTLLLSREAVASLHNRSGVAHDTLNLDLGPLGRLL